MNTMQAGSTALVAFKQQNGTVTILLLNQGNEVAATVKVGEKQFSGVLPAKSLIALETK
jgi:hypothetical protein